MKTLTAIALALLVCTCSFAQDWERQTFGRFQWIPQISAGYNLGIPNGGMRSNIAAVHGVGVSLLFEQPSHRLAAGIDLNIGGYTPSRTLQEYTFSDGTMALMKVNVSNRITSLMANARLYIVANGPVRPYATVRGGYSFIRTRLNILDPDDQDSCEPVETDLLNRDGTFSYSAGGGVRIDAAWLFKNMDRGKLYVDLSSTMLQGGRVQYMTNNPPAQTTNANHSSSMRTRDVEALFIDTTTQIVHPHHVGYLNTSFLQLMDFRLSLAATIGM